MSKKQAVYQGRKKPINGYQALIATLWHQKGGVSQTAKKTSFSKQCIGNWRLRGRVPLSLCARVAAVLNVPVHGLNYPELKKFYLDQIPAWKDVVLSYNFTPMETKLILSLPT